MSPEGTPKDGIGNTTVDDDMTVEQHSFSTPSIDTLSPHWVKLYTNSFFSLLDNRLTSKLTELSWFELLVVNCKIQLLRQGVSRTHWLEHWQEILVSDQLLRALQCCVELNACFNGVYVLCCTQWKMSSWLDCLMWKEVLILSR